MVAGTGFEPAKPGYRSAPPCRDAICGQAQGLPANGAAAEIAARLHLPPAAAGRNPQRAPLVGLIILKNEGTNIIAGITQKHHPDGWCFCILARCTKKDILFFCVIEADFSFINQESR
jgi:hypothetical protein